jgi:hypothetical protein
MLLDFNGSKIRVNVDEENSLVSKHTGALLGNLKVSTTIRGRSANDEFLSRLNQVKTDGVTSISEEGEVQKQWKIGNTSWNYREGSPIYQHTLELTEIEKLNLTSLTLGEITVQPYKYEETFDDDILRIQARVALLESQHLQVKAMQKDNNYFPVIRHGISEEPKQMRFGLCYWSQHNTEYKYELVLMEEGEETKSNRLASAFSWMRTLRNQVADNTAVIDSLLDTLSNKNVLTEDEVVAIRNNIAERSWDVWYGFFRVENVDEL